MAEKTKRGMDDDKFQSIVRSRIQSAVDYVDSDLAPDRERATRFYLGDMKKEAPAPDGRSKVVSRDVRDTVQGIMPSLMRIFMSSEKVVEFQPYGPEDEESADQATDYCNFIVRNDNPGFMVLHSAFKDALIRKTGIVQVWWDKQERVIAKRFEGIDDETFALLMQEQEGSEAEVLDHEQDEQTGTHGFTIKAVKRKGKMCIAAVPPEELIIARDAASFDDAALIGRRSYRTVGELVAEGFDYEEMLNLAGDRAGADEEVLARNNGFDDSEDKIDPSLREVLWCDVFIRCDADGDGITEIHRVQTAGTNYKIKRRDLVDDHHFADFCPEPEPHRAIGESLADCLDDIQLIRTQLLRLSLDGLAQTVTPRLGYLTNGGVDVKQLLDNRVGGVVGMTRPDGVFPLTTDKGAGRLAGAAARRRRPGLPRAVGGAGLRARAGIARARRLQLGDAAPDGRGPAGAHGPEPSQHGAGGGRAAKHVADCRIGAGAGRAIAGGNDRPDLRRDRHAPHLQTAAARHHALPGQGAHGAPARPLGADGPAQLAAGHGCRVQRRHRQREPGGKGRVPDPVPANPAADHDDERPAEPVGGCRGHPARAGGSV